MPRRLKADASPIVVFLGPSLPVDEARRVLSGCYLGPARCGDVMRALRLRPRAIAIVDGLFATTAAVWHKEILVALEEGISVLGASSMGALRAAELAPFGMVGVGKIFEAYRDGTYTDDDEVALLHAPREFGYRAVSEPMVNIRATVTHAVESGIIRAESGDRVIECAKRTFFEQRSIRAAIEQAWGSGGRAAERIRLERFIERGGYVDQKRLDALALLHHLARDGTAFRAKAPGANRTSVILKLQHDVMCSPFESPDADLPLEERVAAEARTLTRLYPMLSRLAQLMAVVHALSLPTGPPRTAHDGAKVSLGRTLLRRRWAVTHDLETPPGPDFIDRLGVVRRNLNRHVRLFGLRKAVRREAEFLLAVLRLAGAFQDLRPKRRMARAAMDTAVLRTARRTATAEFEVYRRIAELWAVVDAEMERGRFNPPISLQSLSDGFRRRRRLERRADTLAWRRANNLDHEGYLDLVMKDARLETYLIAPQRYVLGMLQPATPACWLADAIRVTGLYETLAARLVGRTDTGSPAARWGE